MELFRLNELLICHTTSSFNKKMVCFVRSHTLAVTILYLMGIGTQIWIEIMQDLGLSGFFDTNGLVCEEIFLCLILDSRFWMNNIECIQLNTTWRLNENWSKYSAKTGHSSWRAKRQVGGKPSYKCDQMQKLFFQYLAIYCNENMPNGHNKFPTFFSKFGQTLNKPSKNYQRLYKIWPKWRNLAKSVHTATCLCWKAPFVQIQTTDE